MFFQSATVMNFRMHWSARVCMVESCLANVVHVAVERHSTVQDAVIVSQVLLFEV